MSEVAGADATRRGLLAGAAAGAAVPLLGRLAGAVDDAQAAVSAPPASLPKAARVTVRRGRAIAVSPHGDRVVVAHDMRRTVGVLGPRGSAKVVDVGGQPLDVAVSPDGRTAAVTTASWADPALVLVDLRRGVVRARVAVGPAPYAAAFTGDGRHVIVSGGEQQGRAYVVDVGHAEVLASRPIGLVPRGIAVGAGKGAPAWIALQGEDHLVAVDPRTARIRRTLRAAPLPDRVALSPDGARLLVTHGGPDAERVSDVNLKSGRARHRSAGRLPGAVAWTARGRRLVVLGGAGGVVVLGARGVKRLGLPGSPRDIATAGRRVWAVDGLTGAVSKVTA